uniref:Uncharacterized protein n=1 Tax=Coptotermes formosanus TaxID=36987 RepID=R4UXD9_COPFO|nr:hypothetical protein [Coptotermes formosanus]
MSKIPIQFPPLSQLPNTNVSSPGSFQLFLNKESIRFYNLANDLEGNFPRGFLQEEAKTQHIVDSLQSDSTYIQKESKNLRNAIKSAQERGKYLGRVETAVNMIYRRLNRNGFVGGLAEEKLRKISEDSGVNLDEVRILENMVITIRERIGANYTLENFMNGFHQTDPEKASLIYETVRSLIH